MKPPSIQREIPLQEVFQIMISLGNRIDSYWQRYLYMNFVFTFSLVASFGTVPFVVRMFLFLIFALVLTRTFIAMRETYTGLQVCLEDLRINKAKFRSFPKLTDWTKKANFTNRKLEMQAAWCGSMLCVGVLTIAPELDALGILDFEVPDLFTWLVPAEPLHGPEFPD